MPTSVTIFHYIDLLVEPENKIYLFWKESEAKEEIDLAWFAFCNHLVIHLFIDFTCLFLYLFIFLPALFLSFSFLFTHNENSGKLKSQVLFFRPFLQIDMLLN